MPRKKQHTQGLVSGIHGAGGWGGLLELTAQGYWAATVLSRPSHFYPTFLCKDSLEKWDQRNFMFKQSIKMQQIGREP